MKTVSNFNESNVNQILLYVHNSREIYMLTEWLQSCLVKRAKRDKVIDAYHLQCSSTVHKIINMGSKMANGDLWCNVTQKDKKEAAKRYLDYLIDCVKYLASC